MLRMSAFERINELLSGKYGYPLYIFNSSADLPTKRENRYVTLKGVTSEYATHTYRILRDKLPKFIGYTISDSQITYLISDVFYGWDWGESMIARYVIMATPEKAYFGITYDVSNKSFSDEYLQELPPMDSNGNFIINTGLLTKPIR